MLFHFLNCVCVCECLFQTETKGTKLSNYWSLRTKENKRPFNSDFFTALLLGSIFSHTSQPVCEIESPPTQITTNCDRSAHTNSHAHAHTQPSVLNQPKRQLFKRTMPSFRKQEKPSFTSRPNSNVKTCFLQIHTL